MRVLLDADTPVQILTVLRHLLLPAHAVEHVNELGWSPKKDTQLLKDAAQAGFVVLVTNDRNQLDDPEETAAIKRSRMHHVRYSQKHKGLKGLGLAIGAVVSSMPYVMEELERVNSQRLVHLSGIDPTRRFTAIDPVRQPPRYWR